jgi:putative phosphoribosyl transferase
LPTVNIPSCSPISTDRLEVPLGYLERAKAAALREIDRRRHAYLGDLTPVEVKGRTAIIVDDGISTGGTMLAALRSTRRRNPKRLVRAVPGCLLIQVKRAAARSRPGRLFRNAVGLLGSRTALRGLPEIGDAEVIALLDKARAFLSPTAN